MIPNEMFLDVTKLFLQQFGKRFTISTEVMCCCVKYYLISCTCGYLQFICPLCGHTGTSVVTYLNAIEKCNKWI